MSYKVFTLLLSLLVGGCSVTIKPPVVTGPDFSFPQKSCSIETTTSGRSSNDRSQTSSTEAEVCTWTDGRGRQCQSRTVWTTTWSIQNKDGKKRLIPDRQQRFYTNCR
jgi:hypothetical protein